MCFSVVRVYGFKNELKLYLLHNNPFDYSV
jgi:hypothetical protein